ncbi:DUF551 domain-containing protein [Cronobacter muytjensii]|nr:DUF551 domain-containing protein [Cronobacter muytjensii]
MDGTVHLGGSGTHRAIKGLNKMKRMPLGTKFYTARPAPVVPDCLQRLLKHAEGLTFGSDWNNGTAAKYHRDALIQAVKDCRAAMLNQSQPVAETDTTSQQFESLASVKQPSSIDAATGKASRDSDANSSPDSQATIKQSDGWIPCSERIPEEGGRYWCYVEEINSLGKSHYQWNCSWNGEDWGGEGFYGRVTHWQPLPEPPCK